MQLFTYLDIQKFLVTITCNIIPCSSWKHNVTAIAKIVNMREMLSAYTILYVCVISSASLALSFPGFLAIEINQRHHAIPKLNKLELRSPHSTMLL